jgi:hypothetical protein
LVAANFSISTFFMNASTLPSLARLTIAGLLIAGAASAASIKLHVGANANGGNGGAYTAQILPGSGLTNAPYSNATKNVGNWDPSFETFCLEKWEYFTPGLTYNFTVDAFASGDRNKDGTAEEIDYLSQGTAWLYRNYAIGSYNSLIGTTYASWKALNKDFQAAVWTLEGDINATNYFTNLAKSKFTTLTNAKLDANGYAYGVRALNLYTSDKSGKTIHAQSQLYFVPDTASTLALVGAALAGLIAFRRRAA